MLINIWKSIFPEQQYHVVQMGLGWVGLNLGLGRRASWAVHGIGAWVVHGCMVAWWPDLVVHLLMGGVLLLGGP